MNETVLEDGILKHKTKLKLFINPMLRKLQFFTNKPYVIASYFENNKFIKYQFKRVRYFKTIEEYNAFKINEKEDVIVKIKREKLWK